VGFPVQLAICGSASELVNEKILSLIKDNVPGGRGLDATFAFMATQSVIFLKRRPLDARRCGLVATDCPMARWQATDKGLANAQGMLL
jgi:hypothetical protein